MHIEGPFAFYQKPSQNRQQKAKKNRQRTDGKMLAWIDLFPVIIRLLLPNILLLRKWRLATTVINQGVTESSSRGSQWQRERRNTL